jgi:hypothetical protein
MPVLTSDQRRHRDKHDGQGRGDPCPAVEADAEAAYEVLYPSRGHVRARYSAVSMTFFDWYFAVGGTTV